MSVIPHWQFVENVVAAIESFSNGKLADLVITPKAMVAVRHHPGVRRELDVLVSFRAGKRTMRIGVDVKAEKDPVDLPLLEGLWAKAETLDIDRYAVVSLSGFTGSARTVYSAKGVELVTLEEVGSLEWAGLTHTEFTNQLFEFTAMLVGPDPAHPSPSDATVGRACSWTVSVRGREPIRWLDYLAKDVERITAFKADDVPEGRSADYNVHIDFDTDVRPLLTIFDEGVPVHTPAFVKVSGYFHWNTASYPVVKFRTDRGEEVVSSVIEVPGANVDLVQMSLTMAPSPDGTGTVVYGRQAPARPGRTPVG